MKKKIVIGIIALLLTGFLAIPSMAKTKRGNGNVLESLTVEEIKHIKHIREEEKLARDVYLTLYKLYEVEIFYNISESEQRHMDAVKKLIDKHGIEDPVVDDEIGVFTSSVFTKLYETLVQSGEESYCSALNVGIEIELLDIKDIEMALNEIEATDVNRVFNNLLNGSYNHLNSFTSQHERNCY